MRVLLCFIILSIVLFIFLLIYTFYEAPKYNLDNKVQGQCNISESIKHCSACGQCSTVQDYTTYHEKRNTLTEIARGCAFQDFVGTSKECFVDAGLTGACADCWVENVKCDREHCVFPCIFETIFNMNSNVRNSLSKCFACDEYYCVDIFIGCAGMSRRRAGITTDIERDKSELCTIK